MLRYVFVLAVGVVIGGFSMSLFIKPPKSISNSDDGEVIPVAKFQNEPAVALDLSALEGRLMRLESLLIDLQNQTKHSVDSLATADQSQIPDVKNSSSQVYEEYMTIVRDQIVQGVWGAKQQDELAEVLPKLTEEQKQSVLIQIVQAHKSGELRPALN